MVLWVVVFFPTKNEVTPTMGTQSQLSHRGVYGYERETARIIQVRYPVFVDCRDARSMDESCPSVGLFTPVNS